MKSLINYSLTAIVFAITFSALSVTADESKTKENQNIQENLLRKSGGMIYKIGKGKISFINCQDKISATAIEDKIQRLSRLLKYNMELQQGNWDIKKPKPQDSNLAIFIIADTTMPMSIVAVESGWGVVNVAELNSFEQFSKQLTRVFALTSGAMCSRNPYSPMQPISSIAELKKIKTDNIMRDMIDAIRLNLNAKGLTTFSITSYKKACEEGWAPAPTNDIQKAIWDRVHAAPKNPMKIEFDPKKGR